MAPSALCLNLVVGCAETIWFPHNPQYGNLSARADRHSPLPEACPELFRTPSAVAAGLLPVNGLVLTEDSQLLDRRRLRNYRSALPLLI